MEAEILTFFVSSFLGMCHGEHIGLLGVAVYNVLVKYANKAGVSCFPSYQTIAGLLGISRNTAIKGVEILVKRGLVRKEARTDSKGDPTSNNYIILPVKSPPQPEQRGSAEYAPPVVQSLHRGSAEYALEQDSINKTHLNHTHAITARSAPSAAATAARITTQR